MEERYYFAYGSNMNLEQMKYRCPAAEQRRDGCHVQVSGCGSCGKCPA